MADAGIGSQPSHTHVMVTEDYPNPGDRKGVLTAIERVLNLGGVMRLVVEYGKPLKVSRMVRKDEMPEAPQELIDDDLFMAARNAEIEDFVPKPLVGKRDKPGPFETLFCAFDVLARRRLKPKSILVHTYQDMKAWLPVDANQDLTEIFGLEVRPQKDIPDGVALIVATRWDDPDTVVFSLRLGMDSSKKK